MSNPPINREYLASLCGDDQEFEKELVDSFTEASPGLLKALRVGVAEGDADMVRNAAHTLKGSSRAIGAEPVGRVSEFVEEKARGGELDDLDELIDQLEHSYSEVEAYARQHWPAAG